MLPSSADRSSAITRAKRLSPRHTCTCTVLMRSASRQRMGRQNGMAGEEKGGAHVQVEGVQVGGQADAVACGGRLTAHLGCSSGGRRLRARLAVRLQA